MNDKRISLEITLPSVSLKRFVERALGDDDFFAAALENPLGAFREAGVNLDAKAFIPSDFARFFAVLSRVRELVRQKGGKPTFEAIFGHEPLFSGAVLNAQIERGFFQDWDGRDAMVDKLKCFSTASQFESNRDRGAGAMSVKELCQTQEIQVQAEFLGYRSMQSETDSTSSTEWNQNDSISETRSEQGIYQSFEGQPRRLDDFLNGPLIYPEDLARLTSRIDTFMDITTPGKKPEK